MVNILWFFLPGILALGIITSYTDIKFGKIRNWTVIAAIVYALLAYAVVALLGYDVFQFDLFTNAFFALAVGVGFWFLGLWSAADGKLFFAFALLVPLNYYNLGYMSYVPSFTLVVNIFTPIFLVALFQLIFRTSLNEKLNAFAKITPKFAFNLLLSIFAVHWLMKLTIGVLPGEGNFVLGIVLIFVILALLNKLLKQHYFKAMVGLCILRLIIESQLIFTRAWLYDFLAYLIFYLVFRFAVYHLGFSIYTKQVAIKDLKPGMVLAEGVYKEGKNFKKEKVGRNLFALPNKKFIVQLRPDGLDEKEIKEMQKVNFTKIRIHQVLPFSPFVFFGVLLTIFMKGSILLYVLRLLGKI